MQPAGAATVPQAAAESEADKLTALVSNYTKDRAAILGARPARVGTIAFDRGPSGSPEQAKALADQAAAALAQLRTIKTSELTHDQWVFYGIAEAQARLDAENTADFFWLTSVITPYSSGLRTLTAPFAAAPLTTSADRDAYIAALNQLPATMKAYETRLAQQVAHGVALPTEELRLVIPFVRSLSAPAPKSGLSVAAARLSAPPAADQAVFTTRVNDAITKTVNPSIDALAAYLDGPYRAHTVKNVGVSQYPHGPAPWWGARRG